MYIGNILRGKGNIPILTGRNLYLGGGRYADGSDLKIYSYRHDEVPGIHTIRYESDADRSVITHDAKSRRGFALGAVMAAEFASDHSGLLGMDDLFKDLHNK